MKRLLVFGGSQQIGRRLIERMLVDELVGYDIYTFNRGLTNPDLFKKQAVKKIIGDRNTKDINQVLNQDWDIILDCSCYDPVPFRSLLEKMKGRVGRYVFISTVSVYDYKKLNDKKLITENHDLLKYTEEQIRATGFSHYGEKKVAAEKYLIESDFDAIIFRPHFIYGRYDWQNLDYYWINRIEKYPTILLPGGKDLIHRTYIEGLISILLESFVIEKHQTAYNLMTHDPVTIDEYLTQLSKILAADVSLVRAAPEKLLEAGVRPVLDIPLWSNGSHYAFSTARLATDFQMGFQSHYQSLVETFEWHKEIRNWENGKSKWEDGRLGLKREKEETIIKMIKHDQIKKD